MLSLHANDGEILKNLLDMNCVPILLKCLESRTAIEIINRLIWYHQSFVDDILIPSRLHIILRHMFRSSCDSLLRAKYSALLVSLVSSGDTGRKFVLNALENGREIIDCLTSISIQPEVECLLLLSSLTCYAPIRYRLHSRVEFIESIYESLSVNLLLSDTFSWLSRKNFPAVPENCAKAYSIIRILTGGLRDLLNVSNHSHRSLPTMVQLIFTTLPLTNIFHYHPQELETRPFQVELFLTIVDFLHIISASSIASIQSTLEQIPLLELQTRCSKFWAIADSKHRRDVEWKQDVARSVDRLIRAIGNIYPSALGRCSGLTK
jgi:hypothetical protein